MLIIDVYKIKVYVKEPIKKFLMFNASKMIISN